MSNDKEIIFFTNLFREDLEVPLLLLVRIPLIIDLLLCSQMKNLPNYQKKKDGGKEN